MSEVVNEAIIDPTRGVAFIAGEVNTKMHSQVVQFILALEAKKFEGTPTIYLSTDGGDVSAALGIYDFLNQSKPGVTIVANGECLSSGIVILQAGSKRFATKNAQLLIHFGEETVTSKSEQAHNQRVEQAIRNIISKRSGRKPGTVTQWMNKESYFTAETAKAEGLIDEVL